MSAVDEFRREYLKSVERRVSTATRQLETRLHNAAPVAEGNLVKNTTVRSRGFNVDVAVAVDYATYTIEDTAPHEIVARGAALVFFWPKVGPPQPRFYKRVQHPGTSGTVDWYHDVLDTWPTILEQTA